MASPLFEGDEKQWELDEAQDEVVGGAAPEPQFKQDSSGLAERFIHKYPLAPASPLPPPYSETAPLPRLPLPVVLPQRRPKNGSRGFVRAYAPVLEECGIDQAMFLEFLEVFNQCSLASPWLSAINLASLAASPLPTPISMAISVAVSMETKAAIEAQSRHRLVLLLSDSPSSANRPNQDKPFLDQVNNSFFRPRGIYCLLMTWKPESSETHAVVDLSSTVSSNVNAADTGQMHKLKDVDP